MVPSSLDGLTDEQLAELEAQQGQPEITAGLVDRLAAAPAPTEGFTDRQLDSLPVLASTPFAAERGIALPPEAPAEPEPMTDYELNQLEEENYRRVDYIMPEEEFRQYWNRRKEENNEVGRFVDGIGQGAAGMLAMIPEAGREIRDGMVGMVTDPVNQVQRNVQTGAEVIRKAGINMVQLFDWVGNKVNDVGAWAQRRGLKRQALAKQLEQQGRLSGDELRDAEIIAAAASEADAMEPTPLEEEEDFGKAYERYQREKALEQEFAGVTNFQIGASKVGSPATSKDAYQITDEQPAETLSMLGSMAVDPVNLLPVGAGALSKLRVLRRTATLAGAPLRGVQRAADATADLAERAEFGISSRVQDITGLTAKQQAALGAGAAGAAVYADQAGGGGNFTTAVTAIGSVLPGLRYGGAIIRKTGAAAGGAATIIREAGVGGIGAARAEAATDLARMTTIPQRYRKYFTGYVDGTDSTLKRVAQDAGNPEALRRVARFADRAGVTTAARLADDVTSGAVAAGITGAPFAALQPDAERAGEVLGGIMALGGVAGAAGSAVRRGTTAADADIARMMADVYAVGGNIDKFSQLPHATLDKLAAMQGMLASKVDFVPLRADEYRKNKDTSEVGGEFSAGLFLEKDANNRARIYINLDARPGQGGAAAIAPHEIGHAILTSNVLDGQPRNDLRNLVNQQYGPDGVQARGREYVTRLVDGDIQNGTTGELPQVLTEQEFRDLESGNKSVADIAKGRKLEPSERERLINERYEELSQRSIERGEDALDWARDEIIAETFASEAPAIDFRAIRRDAAFPRLAESMLAAGGRVLEIMGVNLDRSTGRMLDNPSVLFRDNPLFQDRIMQRRVKEYVRAYDQFLTGLEEAGSATPRGVELARSSRPEDMARSTHVKLRDEGRGVLENDFLFQKPDGTYAYKPQPIINAAEANRAAQIKTLYDAKKFVPVNSTEFGKRKVNGREVIGGPVLPPQFDLFTQFPQHVREFARAMEASRAEGGSWNIDYNAIGTGSSGRYRITNMGAVRAIQRETVPFGWQVTKQNHLLAASLDLNAFRAAAMKAVNRGELGIFNNDMKQVEADLKTYLANHRNGMPGEATIGQQKRDTLNGLIGTGTAVQRAANPLYAELNPKGSIRTWRIDRLNDAQPSGRTGYFFDYDKINNNRMPQQIPREAQGMPDAPASGRGQAMPEAATYLDREYNPAELAARAKREGYELVYHGDRNQPASDKYKPWTRAKMPLFTSFDAAAADWFGDPRPLFVRASKVASYDDMISAARRSGVKGTYGERGEPANIPEVRKHSTYEGYNENDLLYIPQVREELRKQGFDAVRVFDQLERDEIDALIVIGSPDQVVDPLKTQGRGQAMPDVPDEVLAANKTARAAGAVGSRAITPRHVAATVRSGETVLNFGAGKPDPATGKYAHSETVRAAGGIVDEFDFGANSVGALGKQYDTVMASNVLNVQSGRDMLRSTLSDIAASSKARAVMNYPESPRYLDLSADDVAAEIRSAFGAEPKIVGGTKRAPLWEVTKPSAAQRGQAMPDAQPAEVRQDGLVVAPPEQPAFKLTPRAIAQFMPDAGVDLAAYADRTVIALPADRMGIGEMMVGPKGKERAMSVKGQGGAGFMQIYNGGGWAFSDEATGGRFMKRLREAAEPGEGSVIVGITAMSEFNHLKNQTGQLAYVEALEAAIAGRSISKKQADAHIKEIAQAIVRSEAVSVGDSTRRKFAAIKNFADFSKAVRAKSLNFADASPYAVQIARKKLPIPYKEAKDIGISFEDIGKQTADPRYADVPFGTVVALLEVPLDQSPVKSDFHYSYPFKVTGNRIGFLKQYYPVGELTSDPRIRNKAGAVQAQPLQTVLPKLDRIPQQ